MIYEHSTMVISVLMVILCMFVIYTVVKVVDYFNEVKNDDIIDDPDRPITDYGTKGEL